MKPTHKELLEALRAVVRVADRETVEFINARAVIAKAGCQMEPTHKELPRALLAAYVDLQEIRNGVDGLEGDPGEVIRLTSLIDGRLIALRDVLVREGIREP
jgi:hypothetical protein